MNKPSLISLLHHHTTFYHKEKKEAILLFMNNIYDECRFVESFLQKSSSLVRSFIYYKMPNYFFDDYKYLKEFQMQDIPYCIQWDIKKEKTDSLSIYKKKANEIGEYPYFPYPQYDYSPIIKLVNTPNGYSLYNDSLLFPFNKKQIDETFTILNIMHAYLLDYTTFLKNIDYIENQYLTNKFDNIAINPLALEYSTLIDSQLSKKVFTQYTLGLYHHSYTEQCQCYHKFYANLVNEFSKAIPHSNKYPFNAKQFIREVWREDIRPLEKMLKERVFYSQVNQFNAVYLHHKLNHVLSSKEEIIHKKHIKI